MREDASLKCSWIEACRAADYAFEHFGNRDRDRGIWIWYCRRIGLDKFLELVDEVISCVQCGELKFPARALQKRLMEMLPKKENEKAGRESRSRGENRSRGRSRSTEDDSKIRESDNSTISPIDNSKISQGDLK